MPPFDAGSTRVARALAACSGYTVIGGGETVAAATQAGIAERSTTCRPAAARRSSCSPGGSSLESRRCAASRGHPPPRRPVFAANWKMNLRRADAEAYADRLRRELPDPPGRRRRVPTRDTPASGGEGSLRVRGALGRPGSPSRGRRRPYRRPGRAPHRLGRELGPVRSQRAAVGARRERRPGGGQGRPGAAARAPADALRRRDRGRARGRAHRGGVAPPARSGHAARRRSMGAGLRAGVGDRHRQDRNPCLAQEAHALLRAVWPRAWAPGGRGPAHPLRRLGQARERRRPVRPVGHRRIPDRRGES